jgi:hypothetical protein
MATHRPRSPLYQGPCWHGHNGLDDHSKEDRPVLELKNIAAILASQSRCAPRLSR